MATSTDIDLLREEVGHLLVCHVVKRDNCFSDAIFDIVADNRKDWDTHGWNVILEELDACSLQVSDWLDTKGLNS